MSESRPRSDVQVFPIPQFLSVSPTAAPVGPVVLANENSLDLWAVTTLRRGLERLGVSLLTDRPGSGVHTVVRVTSDPMAIETLLTRCRDTFGDSCTRERLGREGYLLETTSEPRVNRVTIAAPTGAGQAFGVDSFLQLISRDGEGAILHGAVIYDHPAVPIRVYWGPGDDNRAAALRFNVGRGVHATDEMANMRERHLDSWVGAHPSHADAGKPGLRYSDPDAVAKAIQPLLDAARAGVRLLSLNFDDIDLKLAHPEDIARYGTIGRAHAEFFNTTLAKIRAINPDARLVVIPIVYGNIWFPGTWVYTTREDEIYDYLTTIGREVDPSVILVWTGESIESVAMTDDDIRQWVDLVRRKPVVFENTPTGDLTDFGALRFRTPNIGDLLLGWIYIHRGPQAELAELTTAEYLWNPRAYDPDSAQDRALRRVVGDEAFAPMKRLVGAFTYGDGKALRYKHPLWREGRLLEVVEPDDEEIARYYEDRVRTITETTRELDRLIPDVGFYKAVRKIAVDSLEVASAYLETYRMIVADRTGARVAAIEAGDRAQALYDGWMRYSTGSTDLNGDTDRRAAITYLEQVNTAGRLRKIRRGGSDPIAWDRLQDAKGDAPAGMRLGRSCRLVSPGRKLEFVLRGAEGSEQWLVLSACGAEGGRPHISVDGVEIARPDDAWRSDRWRTVAIPLATAGQRSWLVAITVDAGEWALSRAAVLTDPTPERLLYALRSSAEYGARTRVEQPDRTLVAANGPIASGRFAVRTDIELIRAASGRFFTLDRMSRLGQTFHVNARSERTTAPKNPIQLWARESADGDFLHGFGAMFSQQGKMPIVAALWRWAGDVATTTGDATNWIASTQSRSGSASGDSHHWALFPFDVELEDGTTYYVELTAPGGWTGWRIRTSFGWYGERYDARRSAWLDGAMLKGEDIPFRTYVLDVYDAHRSGGR